MTPNIEGLDTLATNTEDQLLGKVLTPIHPLVVSHMSFSDSSFKPGWADKATNKKLEKLRAQRQKLRSNKVAHLMWQNGVGFRQ